MRRNERGFTLLEVIISMTILSIGLMGIVQLQTRAGVSNTNARNLTAALNLARSQMEKLRQVNLYYIPMVGAAEVVQTPLQNDGDNTDLNNWTAPDHTLGVAVNEAGQPGGMFTVAWNVVDNSPGPNIKTVRVRVSWQEPTILRTVFLETQITRKNLDYYQ